MYQLLEHLTSSYEIEYRHAARRDETRLIQGIQLLIDIITPLNLNLNRDRDNKHDLANLNESNFQRN